MLITGAKSGIAETNARMFAENSTKVVVAGRRMDRRNRVVLDGGISARR